jgi:hypothetical protein
MKDDFFDGAARCIGPIDVPKFVNGLDRQPAQRQESADQENLVEAFHSVNSPTAFMNGRLRRWRV